MSRCNTARIVGSSSSAAARRWQALPGHSQTGEGATLRGGRLSAGTPFPLCFRGVGLITLSDPGIGFRELFARCQSEFAGGTDMWDSHGDGSVRRFAFTMAQMETLHMRLINLRLLTASGETLIDD